MVDRRRPEELAGGKDFKASRAAPVRVRAGSLQDTEARRRARDFTLQSAAGGRRDVTTAEPGERPDGVSVGLQVRYERERPAAGRQRRRRAGSPLTAARACFGSSGF